MNSSDGYLPAEMWETKLVPLLDLFDVLGRRWALRVVWELCETPATFRVLLERAAPISSSVLTDRLRELRRAGVVDHRRTIGYELTDIGKGVADRIIDIYGWLKVHPDWPPTNLDPAARGDVVDVTVAGKPRASRLSTAVPTPATEAIPTQRQPRPPRPSKKAQP